MECYEVRDQLPSYASNLLTPGESGRIDVHLAVCGECRRIADGYASALDELPGALAATSAMTPPVGLRRRVLQAAMAATAGERREVEAAARPTVAAPSVPPPTPPSVTAAASNDRTGPRWWASLARPRAIAAAAAAIVVVGALAWSGYLSVALGRERNSRQELAELLGKQEIVLEVVDSNKTTRVVLKTQEPGSTAYGKLYTRSDFADVVAMAGRLPPASSGQAYYLWVSSGGTTRLAGELTTNSEGFGMVVFDSGTVGPSFDEAFVTRQTPPAESPAGLRVLAWERPP